MFYTRNIAISLLLLLALQSSVSAAPPHAAIKPRSIESLTEGPPKLMEKALGPAAYAQLEVEQLNPDVAWIAYFNYDWHRKMGVQIPPDGLNNPEFRRKVLATYGWYKRGPDDPDPLFTGKKRISYADRYGGYGMGGNLGSGRANINGVVQSKGNPTPLVKDKDKYHSNGRVKSIEGLDEATWGSILEQEMPEGSNQIVCVVMPGAYAKIEGEQPYPTALLWREDPLRPAHYMNNVNENPAIEAERLSQVLPKLLSQLPLPAGYHPASVGEHLHTGILEYVQREAKAQAVYYAKRLYFGSNSPSNVELSGKRLDLGDHTGQNGYTKIHRLPVGTDSPFGETDEFKVVFRDFVRSLKKTLPPEQAENLPTESEMNRHFDRWFDTYREREMVILTGLPPELVHSLESERAVSDLGRVILEVAEAGNTRPVDMIHEGWKNTSKYDLGQALIALADADRLEEKALAEALSVAIDHAPLRSKVVEAYLRVMNLANAQAQVQGITPSSLRIYMKNAARIQNADLSKIQRGDAHWQELWTVSDSGIPNRDFNVTQDYVEKTVHSHLRTHKEAAPFHLILEEHLDSAQGINLQKIFDARLGQYTTLLSVDVSSGSGYFFGHNLTLEQLKSASLSHRSGVRAQAKLNGAHVDFEFPSEVNFNPKALALHLNDGVALLPVQTGALKKYAVAPPVPCEDLLRPARRIHGN